ncbi:tetraspanin-9-like isoform X1 [Palaemon carinicauda]|uniref:tetraspanin-9-like isoform X1 n=2 Tax=Palaemon carinicauda TaxID=392227 RepID=UPI0035B60D72
MTSDELYWLPDDQENREKRMAGRTGFTCVRHTLCVLNTFMWVVGCSMLGAGIWLRLAYGGYASLLHQYAAISADSLCLAAGVITFILAFCGCCGSWFQSRCMLITYFSLVVVVFALQLVAGTLAFAFRAEVSSTLISELQAGIRRSFNETNENAVGITWNHLQAKFRCCGVEGPSDWYNIAAWPREDWVPRACCLPKYVHNPDCGKTDDKDKYYQSGCFVQVKMWFIERLHLVGVIGLIFAFVQLFGMIASMLLFCTLGHKRRSHTYKSYHSDT